MDPVVDDALVNPRFGMGLLPSQNKGRFKAFAATNPIIPRAQWNQTSFRFLGVPILNQGSHGSCVGHGSVTAFWNAWLLSGATPQQFSACWIYGLINGGRDAGASIDQALTVIEEQGVGLLSDVPEGMVFKRNFPAQAATNAARFKAEGYVANTVDELGTGLQLGFFPVFGVTVGMAFQNYSGTGLIRVGFGPANHCVTADGMQLVNGAWVLNGVNSWGTSWGDGGHFLISLDSIAKDEMYLVRYSLQDPNDPQQPPVAA